MSGINSSGSKLEPVASSYEHGNKHYCSIKGGEFLNQLKKY